MTFTIFRIFYFLFPVFLRANIAEILPSSLSGFSRFDNSGNAEMEMELPENEEARIATISSPRISNFLFQFQFHFQAKSLLILNSGVN